MMNSNFKTRLSVSLASIILFSIYGCRANNNSIQQPPSQLLATNGPSIPSPVLQTQGQLPSPFVTARPTQVSSDSLPKIVPSGSPSLFNNNVTNSPGGKIAFVLDGNGSNGIVEYTLGDQTQMTITNTPYIVYFHPSWSPDGKRLVFSTGGAGSDYIMVEMVDLKTQVEKEITAGSDPDWSPDGNEIVLAKDQLYIYNFITRTLKQLTNIGKSEIEYPAWSPDGKKIAFLNAPNIHAKSTTLNVIDVDGNNLHQIVMSINPGWGRITWSPDSKEIAFRSIGECGDICTVDIQSGKSKCLTNTPGGETDPAWSPDGEWIIYSAIPDPNYCQQKGGEPITMNWKLYLMKQDGSEVRPLILADPQVAMVSAVWYPVINLKIGKKFYVTPLGDGVRIRLSPSTKAEIITQLKVGDRFTVIGGSMIIEDKLWWKIQREDQEITGWIAEEDGWYRPVLGQ